MAALLDVRPHHLKTNSNSAPEALVVSCHDPYVVSFVDGHARTHASEQLRLS